VKKKELKKREWVKKIEINSQKEIQEREIGSEGENWTAAKDKKITFFLRSWKSRYKRK